MIEKYYTWIPPGKTEPQGLFRFFFGDEGRVPEYFKIGSGWTPDIRLHDRLVSGEIDESDEISPSAAAELIVQWNGGRS